MRSSSVGERIGVCVGVMNVADGVNAGDFVEAICVEGEVSQETKENNRAMARPN